MKARRKSVLMLLIILLSFLFPLSAYSEKNCQSIRKLMQTAVLIRDRDIDLGTEKKKEPYIKKLEDVLESLNSCKKNVKDPFVNLEIDTLINSIEGKIKQVVDLDPYENKNCQKCEDIEECIKLCNEYRKKKEWWRKEYVETIQGHDMLDCEKCIEDLEKYYSIVKGLLEKKELDLDQNYSKESITALSGILYSISQNDECLEKGQDTLQRVILPFVMLADLIRRLIEIFEGLTLPEQEKLLEENKDARSLMNIFIEVFRTTDPDILAKLLSNMLEKKPDDIEEIMGLLSLDHLVIIFTKISERFRALPITEQERLLGREEDALYLINWFIEVFRTTDPDFALGLKLTHRESAKLLSKIIKENPDNIEEILGLLPAHDLLTLLSERFKELPTTEQDMLFKRKKEDVRYIVKRFVDFYRETDPRMLKEIFASADGKRPPLKYKYLTSFLMPGYVRSYHEEQKTSSIVKAWNYSNIALLGLAVVSEATYINTDYDNDALFHIGVTATVAFIVNGVLGVWDADYESSKNNAAGTAITVPYISINGQYDAPALMFTFKF